MKKNTAHIDEVTGNLIKHLDFLQISSDKTCQYLYRTRVEPKSPY